MIGPQSRWRAIGNGRATAATAADWSARGPARVCEAPVGRRLGNSALRRHATLGCIGTRSPAPLFGAREREARLCRLRSTLYSYLLYTMIDFL